MYNTDLPSRAELPSSAQLIGSTVVAAAVAAGLLVAVVLPAEHGVDPTGIGSALRLTPMGEIKADLAEQAHRAQHAAATPAPTPSAPTHPPAAPAPANSAAGPATPAAPSAAPTEPWRDITTVVLKNGEAAEVKLTMQQGEVAGFEWSSGGAPVNYDTHGDPVDAPRDFYHGYGKGRNKMGDSGQLQAAFDGVHGWFWRNRSGTEVTITLKTRGQYGQVKRVM